MLRRPSPAVFALFAAIVGCGTSSKSSSAAGADGGAGPSACVAPTYRGALDAACVTGGYATCSEGTQTRASGWGCEAIVAETACTGATREAIGEAGCVPVGDCNAPFPPSGATHFVAPLAMVDATHFQTIVAAIAAAPAGAVIAIDAGSYPDALDVTKDVTLVGRCPAKVFIGTPSRAQALHVETPHAKVSGVTVQKTFIGVSLAVGAGLVLEDSIVDGNAAVGISLSEGQASIELTRVVVRGTTPGDDGRGAGLNAQASSVVVARDSAFVGNPNQNIRLSTKSEGTFERIVVRDGKPTPSLDYGRGLQVQDGAKATLTSAAFLDNYEVAIVAAGDIEMHDVTIGRTRPAASGEWGRALNAFGGATVRGDRVHAYDNHDASVMVDGAGTTVTLTRSAIVDTGLDRYGVVGRAIAVQNGAALVFEDSAVVASHEAGIAVFSAGTQATLRRSVVTLTAARDDDAFGDGVLATLGGSVAIEDSEISASSGTGIAIGTGSARLSRVRIRGNQIGLYVQDGTTLREVADATAPPGALEVTVSTDSVFVDNQTRLSAGVLPLPEPSRLATP